MVWFSWGLLVSSVPTMCVGQRTTLGAIPQALYALFFKTGSLLTWSLSVQLDGPFRF